MVEKHSYNKKNAVVYTVLKLFAGEGVRGCVCVSVSSSCAAISPNPSSHFAANLNTSERERVRESYAVAKGGAAKRVQLSANLFLNTRISVMGGPFRVL